MIGASLYITVCSARNRARVRLRRLREPRYLVGALAGLAYIYFSFFGRFRAQRASRRRRNAPLAAAAVAALVAGAPALIAIALMLLTMMAWLMPFDSGLLEFSKAEEQFLFPAPVSRRWLLVHRMLRSQLGMLFGAVVVALTAPSVSGYGRLRVSIAMWLLMCTTKVYFTGVTLARARLGAADARARRVAWMPLAAMSVALVIVGASVARAFAGRPYAGFRDVLTRLGSVAGSGASSIVMAPFLAVTRPLFAGWPQQYLIGLAGSAAVLVACAVWVLQSDAAFQEATTEVAERKSRERTTTSASYRVRGAAAWRLAATGRAEAAFIWKSAMQTLRIVDRRAIARIVTVVLALTIAASSIGRANGLVSVVGAFSIAASLFTVLMAPQVLRIDMRQDLQHLELLKTWPVPPSAVVRGEIVWPGVLITAIAWLTMAIAMALSATTFSGVAVTTRLSLGVSSMIVAPALVFAQLVVHNAAALIFPAWVPIGHQRPRGFEAVGQRLILLAATWLILLAIALPGGVVGGVIWFILRGFVGALAYVAAAGVAAVIIAVEVLVATEALGPAYERIDILAVERAE